MIHVLVGLHVDFDLHNLKQNGILCWPQAAIRAIVEDSGWESFKEPSECNYQLQAMKLKNQEN